MKKHVSLILALLLLLGLFSGCGDKTPAPAAQDDAPAVQSAPEEDYLPLVKDGESKSLTIGVLQQANVIDYDTNEYTLWLEEKTGIDLSFQYFSTKASEASQQLALMMAGGERLPDILWDFNGISVTAGQQYGEDGYFIDLLPYFDEYAHFFNEATSHMTYQEDIARMMYLGTEPDSGALYGFPCYQRTRGTDFTTNHIVINTKWLEAVGEEMPRTPEDFKRVLQKFRDNDPNGNGEADEIPMVGSTKISRANTLEWILDAFIYVNDNYFWDVEDGKLYAPQLTDEYRQGLIYLNDLYKEGLLSPLIFSIGTYGEMKELFTPSSGTSIVGVSGGHIMLTNNDGSELPFDYAIMPTLDAGTGKGGYRAVNDASYSYCTFITEDCEDPVLAFRLLDFMTSPESFFFMRYGVEGRDWERSTPEMVDRDGNPTYFNLLDSTVYSAQNNVNWHSLAATIADYTAYPRYVAPDDADGSWEARINGWYEDCLDQMLAIPEKPELCFTMVFPASVSEEKAGITKQLLSYVEQARAQFVTGELDPRSDSDWQNYLDTMERIGVWRYLELAQDTYDRMMGK